MPKLYRYIYSRINGDNQLAEDLTSEIFMKALEKFDQYDRRYPFGAWLFGIARNHLIDHYKKNYHKAHVDIAELENILPDNTDVAHEAERNISIERLQSALLKLKPDKKELVTLRYLSGYTYNEMAEILEKDENAIKVATFRAMKELKKMLTFYSE